LKLSLERIAFYRVTLASKCNGQLDRWRKEYPGDPEEAFTASGDPVFNFENMHSCEQWSENIKFKRIELSTASGHRARAEEKPDGRFVLFEWPQPGAHYFAGVMVGHADGTDENSTDVDTLAMVIWNGETGVMAGRFHLPLQRETATSAVYAFGCYFNKAMIACEDGQGGFGTTLFQKLRDHFRYPNQYRWKGRNDKVDAQRATTSLGFTLNDYCRRMTLQTLLTAIEDKSCITNDPAFTEQMSDVQWDSGWRFEALAGVDEIFWAGALGWMAKDQWHPQKCKGYTADADTGEFEELLRKIPHQKSPFSTESGILTMSLQGHLDQIKQREQERIQNEIYNG
jgi:hypothetical protein